MAVMAGCARRNPLPDVVDAAPVGAWAPDRLMAGYEARTIVHPDDYSGPVVSTVVRRQSADSASHRGILYVHGYNDYFFQDSLARELTDSGYSFYAVDLRKYGRSLREGQQRFQARDLNEYFPDIDSAIALMRKDGITDISLMGHSTGGLITSLYMENHPAPEIKRLILNSPFLDWNFTGAMRNLAIPGAAALGGVLPDVAVPQGDNPVYGKSLLKDWRYDTTLKVLHAEPITPGWVRAIDNGHKTLQANGAAIKVPVLLMHSARSANVEADDPEALTMPDGRPGKAFAADLVLNVDSISSRGRRLGRDVTEVVIDSGLHDLFLSLPRPRRQATRALLDFLKK